MKIFSFGLILVLAVVLSGCVQTTGKAAAATKEFHMDSFVVFEDDQPKPQFSLKEITVNKGDTMKLYINVTRGTHDFKIDEFGVNASTPTGQVTTVEFVADKAGEFVYYCNMPGHRAAGHWGTLRVLE